MPNKIFISSVRKFFHVLIYPINHETTAEWTEFTKNPINLPFQIISNYHLGNSLQKHLHNQQKALSTLKRLSLKIKKKSLIDHKKPLKKKKSNILEQHQKYDHLLRNHLKMKNH